MLRPIALLLMLPILLSAQKNDKKLDEKIRSLAEGFRGQVGIYVQDLKSGRIATLNEDSIFSTASIVKIPIMIGIMSKIMAGELDYHQVLTYSDSLYYKEGEDILASFKPNEKISLSKLMMLSISTSDNTASLWLQGLAGGGVRINQLMDSLGFKVTRVNSRTPGREEFRNLYGWGQTTAKEICHLVGRIAQGEILGREACNRMLRILGRQYWDEWALSQIPPNVYAADKTGSLDDCRNEVVYVNATHPYIFSIFTRKNQDQSWEYNNEAWVLTRKLSRMLWEYYNPKLRWEAAPLSK
ncbi:MAG TPA: serine hydrolase [Puia sp.]|nr:serine hydrolase [Puia sp.]